MSGPARFLIRTSLIVLAGVAGFALLHALPFVSRTLFVDAFAKTHAINWAVLRDPGWWATAGGEICGLLLGPGLLLLLLIGGARKLFQKNPE